MNVTEHKRIAFTRTDHEWTIACVRCDWTYTQAMPVDTDTWTYLNMHHSCNTNYYTDAERMRASSRMNGSV